MINAFLKNAFLKIVAEVVLTTASLLGLLSYRSFKLKDNAAKLTYLSLLLDSFLFWLLVEIKRNVHDLCTTIMNHCDIRDFLEI